MMLELGLGGLGINGGGAVVPELATNGGFDTDTGWTKGSLVTISGGVATLGAGGGYLEQMITTEAGRAYRVTATAVSGLTYCGAWNNAGQSGILSLAGGGNSPSNRSGTFSFVFVAVDATSYIGFASGGGATLDNVSVVAS